MPEFFKNLDRQSRRWPIASVQRTLSTLASHSAVPRGTNVKRMNANHAIRIGAQRMQGLSGLISVFREERYHRQQTLTIRIAAITLASDSAITIARFRPSKLKNIRMENLHLNFFRPKFKIKLLSDTKLLRSLFPEVYFLLRFVCSAIILYIPFRMILHKS